MVVLRLFWPSLWLSISRAAAIRGALVALLALPVLAQVAAPTVTAVNPTSGVSTGGIEVTIIGTNFTGATSVQFGGTVASAFSVVSSTALTAVAPAGSGTVDITVTNGDGTSATSAADHTYVAAPVAGAVSVTVGYDSSANPITLNLGGGTAITVVIPSGPSHGTLSVVGTSVTYTPTGGYAGADSFTYTAANTAGTSSAATVSISVTAPTLPRYPDTQIPRYPDTQIPLLSAL